MRMRMGTLRVPASSCCTLGGKEMCFLLLCGVGFSKGDMTRFNSTSWFECPTNLKSDTRPWPAGQKVDSAAPRTILFFSSKYRYVRGQLPWSSQNLKCDGCNRLHFFVLNLLVDFLMSGLINCWRRIRRRAVSFCIRHVKSTCLFSRTACWNTPWDVDTIQFNFLVLVLQKPEV